MPTYAMAGAASGCPKFDGIKSIMYARHNTLSGADFAQPPRKSFLQKLVELLSRSIEP